MKYLVPAFVALLLLSSCTVIKRNYRSGFYISKTHQETAGSLPSQSSPGIRSTLSNPLDCVEVVSGSGKTKIDRSEPPSCTPGCTDNFHQSTALLINLQDTACSAKIPVAGQNKIHKKVSRALTADTHSRVKWWEILLAVIVLALGIACFAAIIIAGAATPLLVGILLIIPGTLIYASSGLGGVVFSATWGLFYIGVSPFKDGFSNDNLILYGILSLVLSLLIGISTEEWSKKKAEKKNQPEK